MLKENAKKKDSKAQAWMNPYKESWIEETFNQK
jgi:hypothetical protein